MPSWHSSPHLCFSYLSYSVPVMGQCQACSLPDSDGWCSGSTIVEIPNPCDPGFPTPEPTLTVTVWYCYPAPLSTVLPKEQFRITEIQVSPDCTILGPEDMLAIEMALIKADPEGTVPCSAANACEGWCDNHPTCNCPYAYADFQTSHGSCMLISPMSDEEATVYVDCGLAWCTSIWEVCCRNGIPDPTWLVSSGLEACTGQYALCSSMCPVGSAPEKHCCDWEGNPCESAQSDNSNLSQRDAGVGVD